MKTKKGRNSICGKIILSGVLILLFVGLIVVHVEIINTRNNIDCYLFQQQTPKFKKYDLVYCKSRESISNVWSSGIRYETDLLGFRTYYDVYELANGARVKENDLIKINCE